MRPARTDSSITGEFWGQTADDLDILRPRITPNPSNKSATAHSHENRVQPRLLAQHLHGDGCLPGDDLRVVVGGDEDPARLLCGAAGGRLGVDRIARDKAQFHVEVVQLCHFARRGILWHENRGGNPQLGRGVGHGQPVISRGRGDDTQRPFRRREADEFVGCPAQFERAGRLPVFQFEKDGRARSL